MSLGESWLQRRFGEKLRSAGTAVGFSKAHDVGVAAGIQGEAIVGEQTVTASRCLFFAGFIVPAAMLVPALRATRANPGLITC